MTDTAAPTQFDVGHASVVVTEFTTEVVEAGRRAASTCPEQAIVAEA